MKVTVKEYKALQDAVYDGYHNDKLVPLYVEFADFAGTSFTNPVFVKLIEGLTKIKVV